MKRAFILLITLITLLTGCGSDEVVVLPNESADHCVQAMSEFIDEFSLGNGEHSYPSNYGGSFIEDDIRFVIQTTDNDHSFYERFNKFSCIEYRIVEYSLDDLERYKLDVIYKNQNLSSNYVVINEKRNRIDILVDRDIQESEYKIIQETIKDIPAEIVRIL